MVKIHNIEIVKGAALPNKKKRVSTAQQAPSADTERVLEHVLEHVASPFRWELLDVPVVQQKISIPEKPAKP